MGYTVAVVGATGAVGTQMIKMLEESSLPIDKIRFLASARSAGKTLQFKGQDVVIEETTETAFEGVDIALFSAGGSTSAKFAPYAVKAGAVVVDNTSFFRQNPNVPLVVPEVNAHALEKHNGIIACPNCSTIQMMVALEPIRQAYGLERVIVSTYQAVSGAGQSAINETNRELQEALDGKALTEPVTPLGYILLANPIREAAKETFQYFAEQGVEVKVISGDNPVTVSKVAKTAGIKNAENYVDASSLETEEDIKKAILEKTVFGRVTPNQKRQFVQALKEAGKTVAMTGDGVNDVLALKDADCSIAMASGSEAAAQASQIVLLESDFSCMPQVVLEGRRVVNNIQRSASLFLVKNIFSFLLSLFSVVFMFTYPLEPSQVSLISMFTIGIPAFFLALEPNKNIIKGHFLTNVFLKALPAALTDALAVGSLVVFGKTFGVGEQDISTAATMLLAIVGFMILYKISAPMNKLRAGILGGCIAGLLFCSIYLNQLFAISGMTTKCIMLFVVFAIATEPVLRYLTILLGKGRFYYRRLRGKAPLEEEA